MVQLYSNYGDPFGHWQTESTQSSIFTGSVWQQTNGGEKADPVEKERDHESAQEHALAAHVLVIGRRVGCVRDCS
jgi:hypothetical protein